MTTTCGWNLEGRLTRTAPADALVLFASRDGGISDDTAAALYGMARHGHLTMPVGIVHTEDTPLDAVRTRIKDANERRGPIDRDTLGRVLGVMRSVDLQNRPIAVRPLYHLALQPAELAGALEEIRRNGGAQGGRALLDKPFGHDLHTARALNHLLGQIFAERDIFRVDHYLLDDRIHQLLSFRQSHAFVEPLWNRHHVESVQITVADADGVADGAQYDRTGAIRDTLQSDVLHLLASVAMDLPAGADSEVIRGERARLLKTVRTAAPGDLVRGQFRGYHRGPHVRCHSTTETFAAVRLAIDSDRWAGVPFHLRTGRRLAATVAEVVVKLRPLARATAAGSGLEGGYVRFRCAPTAAIEVVTPAFTRRPSERTADYGPTDRPRVLRSALEEMLTDAIRGNSARFARRDHVEDAWRIVSRLVDDESPVLPYEAGSWGPVSVNRASAPDGGWANPVPSRAADSSLSRSAQAARR